MDYSRITETLKRHEGVKLKPYQCTSGKLTIGCGRNLEDKGISEYEALMMLHCDILESEKDVLKNIDFYKSLNDARQEVLVNMCFNLGISGLLGFKKFLSYLSKKDYKNAASEMLKSTWANQVGDRAKELSMVILTGEWIYKK